MKIQLVQLRDNGVRVSRDELKYKKPKVGELVISQEEMGLGRYRRLVKLARFTYTAIDDKEAEMVLYEPEILWIRSETFCLFGLERVQPQGPYDDWADVAQSWICSRDGDNLTASQ